MLVKFYRIMSTGGGFSLVLSMLALPCKCLCMMDDFVEVFRGEGSVDTSDISTSGCPSAGIIEASLAIGYFVHRMVQFLGQRNISALCCADHFCSDHASGPKCQCVLNLQA